MCEATDFRFIAAVRNFLPMIPNAAQIESLLLERFADGAEHETTDTIKELARNFQLTPSELKETDGSHPRFLHKVHSALSRHFRLKLLQRPARGRFRYFPDKVSRYEPRYRPRSTHAITLREEPGNVGQISPDDQFPAHDYKTLAGLVVRHGKEKLLRVLKAAF
jgi:hypothetical protein